MGDVILEKLGAVDLHQVSRFRLDDPEHVGLRRFIRRDARKSADEMWTQTYIARREDSSLVIGFVSLMCAEVKLAPEIAGNRYTLQPAIRIARLAVDDSHRNCGIGNNLLDLTITIAIVEIAPRAGCRFLIADSKRGSLAFYERYGFRVIDTDENRRRAQPTVFMDLKPLV